MRRAMKLHRLWRGMIWGDTRLRWTQTSPHIPHALHAQVYAATGMVASVTTNVSDGVGRQLSNVELQVAHGARIERTICKLADHHAGRRRVR